MQTQVEASPSTRNQVGPADVELTAITQRAERIKTLSEMVTSICQTCMYTADRLHGAEPSELKPEIAPDMPMPGSFMHLDFCLDEMEAELRRAMHQANRLSGT